MFSNLRLLNIFAFQKRCALVVNNTIGLDSIFLKHNVSILSNDKNIHINVTSMIYLDEENMAQMAVFYEKTCF